MNDEDTPTSDDTKQPDAQRALLWVFVLQDILREMYEQNWMHRKSEALDITKKIVNYLDPDEDDDPTVNG